MGYSFEDLKKYVLDNSSSKNWKNAVLEWELIDTEEDEDAQSRCICGKENIRYLHRIINNTNGRMLFPVGSSCIKRFNRADLNEKISVKEKLFKLYHAVENNSYLKLTTEIFSRKLINYLYESGAFISEDGRFPARNSYEFFLKMFNKRNKDEITERERKKIAAIILNNIKPFAEKQLAKKVLKK